MFNPLGKRKWRSIAANRIGLQWKHVVSTALIYFLQSNAQPSQPARHMDDMINVRKGNVPRPEAESRIIQRRPLPAHHPPNLEHTHRVAVVSALPGQYKFVCIGMDSHCNKRLVSTPKKTQRHARADPHDTTKGAPTTTTRTTAAAAVLLLRIFIRMCNT